MSEQDDTFRVEDRRRFDPETGAPRADARDETPLPGGGVLKGHAEHEDAEIPVRFDDLVRPFLLMGLAGLGVIPHPDSGQPKVDLSAARAAIETLELLKSKTEGSREAAETALLEHALYELKVYFVEVRDRRKG